MSKPSPSAVTRSPVSAPAQPERLETPSRAHAAIERSRPWLLWVGLTLLVAATLATLWAIGHADAPAGSDDLLLCWRFAALNNARESGAEKLLSPAVAVPRDVVSPEEAARIDADTFLRRDLIVVNVRPDDAAKDGHRFILTTKGGAAGEPLRVRSGAAVDRIQRMVTNPDVVVEVRDGKLYAVRPQVGGQ